MSKQATKLSPLTGNPFTEAHRPLPVDPFAWSKSLKSALFVTITWNILSNSPALELDTLKPDQWRTRAQFFEQLDATVSVDWQENPLNQLLSRLSLSQRMAIFLDRRINPDQKISLRISAQPLRKILDGLASQINGEVGFVDSVIYLGPRFTAERLATVAEMQNQQVRKLSKTVQQRLLEKQPTSWPRLSEPSQLLDALTREAGMLVENQAALGHDLWPAYTLPPLTFPERMTLLLAGFHMSYRFLPDGKTIQLIRFPKTVFVEKKYPAGNDPAKRTRQIEKLIPHAFVEKLGNQILVRSLLEDHWEIQRQKFSASSKETDHHKEKGLYRYSLTVKSQPVGALLNGLAKRLSLTIKFTEDALDRLEQRISFSLKNATAAELFDAAATPAGLKIDILDDAIQVSTNGR